MLNYEVLKTIYNQRRGHKLSEWREFCNYICTLPYANEFIKGGRYPWGKKEEDGL